MSYSQTIVCLANSRKHSGRCIAGKLLLEDGSLGAWIRPVSARPSAEISEEEMRDINGEYPNLLDILEIEMLGKKPITYQSENHIIDSDFYWENKGKFPFKNLTNSVDSPSSLWTNGDSTYYGSNDRVRLELASSLTESLFLIHPSDLEIQVKSEGAEFGNPRRRVRAKFHYNSTFHSLIVTDPFIERKLFQKQDDTYKVKNAYLCVSLGEAHTDGSCYKLVASVISENLYGAKS